MIYLHALLWVLIILFAIIGTFRGASRELLVTIAAMITLFALDLLGNTKFFQTSLPAVENGQMVIFWIRTVIMTILTLAGYQIPKDKVIFKDRIAGSSRMDTITGFLVGGLNGYLIWGSLWYFLREANYPGAFLVNPVDASMEGLRVNAMNIATNLPPDILNGTVLYIGVALLVVFILVIVV